MGVRVCVSSSSPFLSHSQAAAPAPRQHGPSVGAAVPEDEDAEEHNGKAVAWLLQRGGRKILSDLETQAGLLAMSRRQLQRSLYALAEGSLQSQMAQELSVLQYAAAMHHSEQYRPLLYLRHEKHDETPLKLRCQYEEERRSHK